MTGKEFRAATLIGAAALALAFAGETRAQNSNGNNQGNNTWPHAWSGNSPVLAVVGDIACQPDEDFVAGGGAAAHETCAASPPPAPQSSSGWPEIGRAHVCTPVTSRSRMLASA